MKLMLVAMVVVVMVMVSCNSNSKGTIDWAGKIFCDHTHAHLLLFIFGFAFLCHFLYTFANIKYNTRFWFLIMVVMAAAAAATTVFFLCLFIYLASFVFFFFGVCVCIIVVIIIIIVAVIVVVCSFDCNCCFFRRRGGWIVCGASIHDPIIFSSTLNRYVMLQLKKYLHVFWILYLYTLSIRWCIRFIRRISFMLKNRAIRCVFLFLFCKNIYIFIFSVWFIWSIINLYVSVWSLY